MSSINIVRYSKNSSTNFRTVLPQVFIKCNKKTPPKLKEDCARKLLGTQNLSELAFTLYAD